MKRLMAVMIVIGLLGAVSPVRADYSYVHVESSNGNSKIEVRQEVSGHSYYSSNMDEAKKKEVLTRVYEKQIKVYEKLITRWQKLGWDTTRFEKEIEIVRQRMAAL